jgi:hypothetical protein
MLTIGISIMKNLKVNKWIGFTLFWLAVLLALVLSGAFRDYQARVSQLNLIQKEGEQIAMRSPDWRTAQKFPANARDQDRVCLVGIGKTGDRSDQFICCLQRSKGSIRLCRSHALTKETAATLMFGTFL